LEKLQREEYAALTKETSEKEALIQKNKRSLTVTVHRHDDKYYTDSDSDFEYL